MSTIPEPVLCLASVSPRRQELLAQIGVPHTVVGAHIDETARLDEGPRDYVMRMAREKALAVRGQIESKGGKRLPVLAADTTVVLDEVIFGKPKGRADGLAMLGTLSGRTHEVLTAVALSVGEDVSVSVSTSQVRLRPLSLEECAAYWETGEPLDKAGGYAIQGRGAAFIEWLSGSYSGVMGLPLYETAELLRGAGVPCWHGGLR
jgi:septum formation protein